MTDILMDLWNTIAAAEALFHLAWCILVISEMLHEPHIFYLLHKSGHALLD